MFIPALGNKESDYEQAGIVGVGCGEAENQIEAVEKARELSPDLIVLGLTTLLMSGFEAAQALKQAKPDVPLFMITVDYTVATEREALSRGICAVFAKDDDLMNCLLPNARAVYRTRAKSLAISLFSTDDCLEKRGYCGVTTSS